MPIQKQRVGKFVSFYINGFNCTFDIDKMKPPRVGSLGGYHINQHLQLQQHLQRY